jgi:pimeloyl-ACP methyl ester carboxylesterase
VRIESTDGVAIALHDLGGSGPPLLVAHATGFLAAPYRMLAEGLTGEFHVFGVDFRAHGDSTSTTTGELTWKGMGDDVLAVVDHIGAPITGFGHSMGGAALLVAERARPGTVRSAFLYEPIIPPSPLPAAFGAQENPMAASARKRRATFPSRAEALARYAGRPPLGMLRADALAAYVEEGFADQPDGTVTLKCTPEDEAATFEAAGYITTADLGEIDLPVTVAVGERHDGFGPPLFVPPIVEALPRGELVGYAHLDHFGPFQDPDTIAEDVIRRTRA